MELCALPVKDLLDNDAVLFMWVTSPLLAECFAVIAAWGFEYKLLSFGTRSNTISVITTAFVMSYC